MFKNIYNTFGGLFWILTGLRRANGDASICETRLFPDQEIMMDRCNTIYSIEIYDILSKIIHSILISDLYAYILRIVWPSQGYVDKISFFQKYYDMIHIWCNTVLLT